ncbi:expressed unknown protein [Seminavis robusta]|uniref:DUF6815 domain-containing protein n=1 Tax=Seminavis robusta TaxID=568900 RepID=A0A9N8DLC2_9STRA|nr:expressed unknown protein [Seminavis robusta]|eukprot:Sro119_g058230.1 n/a (543) ;mRNA; r:97461-99163
MTTCTSSPLACRRKPPGAATSSLSTASDSDDDIYLTTTCCAVKDEIEAWFKLPRLSLALTLRSLLCAAAVALLAVVLPQKSIVDNKNDHEIPRLGPLSPSLIHSGISSQSVLLAGPPLESQCMSEPLLSKREGDDSSLLRNVTTAIGGYDPLASHTEAERFIPVLEATGYNDNDKDEYGHRRDTIPIAQAVADHQEGTLRIHTAIFQFLEEDSQDATKTNHALYSFLSRKAQGIIVRNNPGTLSAASQRIFDDMMRQLANDGLVIMTHPDVTSTLGAKDSLVQIKDLKCGLDDTQVYYDPESFREGFRRSIAMQPRVIKQNRGSQGEGIWIVHMKDSSEYCAENSGSECMAALDTELVLMEAWDNHVEHHTVEEFLEFCIHGRTDQSGEWNSTGKGQYFDGGLEAGSLMVDMRFLPRISEGEVRCLFVGSELVEIVHKKPKEGGLSATLASGAVYTKYTPDDPKFARFQQHLQKDVPLIMESMEMKDRHLPLLWTADYIFGDTDDDLYISEINCSCPGITQQLEIVPIIAKVAFETTFPHAV